MSGSVGTSPVEQDAVMTGCVSLEYVFLAIARTSDWLMMNCVLKISTASMGLVQRHSSLKSRHMCAAVRANDCMWMSPGHGQTSGSVGTCNLELNAELTSCAKTNSAAQDRASDKIGRLEIFDNGMLWAFQS
mmetsp:Transcript_24123/g.48856  ORF Transcript_24123/g.48856 Transcript_24123/m.48856 type:complete len:132 (-) Transcript_24123:125-520(-)